jgi:hypothetical protein
MQQHRGSQIQKPKPPDPRDAVAQSDIVTPAGSARPEAVERREGELI